MALMIRSSAIHAAGCYTTEAIAKGSRVAEYTGHLLTKAEADERYQDATLTYLFGLGDGSIVIDGHSMAMFLNHSCQANCETSEDEGRVWITARRKINAGEELTYDYCLFDGGDEEAHCNCGAANCRGTMYSPEEIAKRIRQAAASHHRKSTKDKSSKGKSRKSNSSKGQPKA